MNSSLYCDLSPKAKAMLSRLPDNLRDAVLLMAAVISRKDAENPDKAPERLETAANGALIAWQPTNRRQQNETQRLE